MRTVTSKPTLFPIFGRYTMSNEADLREAVTPLAALESGPRAKAGT
jgi:hypothetical protein